MYHRLLLCGLFLLAAQYALAQGCKVRYQYDSAGNRIQRDWYCWTGNEEEEEQHEDRLPIANGPNETRSASVMENLQLSLHPNPASESVFLSLSSSVESARVEVLDASGQVLLTNSLQGTSLKLDVSSLSIGVYFARISLDHEYILSTFTIVGR